MIVDFPDPEGPIRPIVWPGSKVIVRFFRTLRSGLEG